MPKKYVKLIPIVNFIFPRVHVQPLLTTNCLLFAFYGTRMTRILQIDADMPVYSLFVYLSMGVILKTVHLCQGRDGQPPRLRKPWRLAGRLLFGLLARRAATESSLDTLTLTHPALFPFSTFSRDRLSDPCHPRSNHTHF